jgi:hypothetical protein
MAHYRLYCFDHKRKISTAEWIKAESDQEAIAIAQSMNLSCDCELWLSDRLVVELPLHPITA